MCNPAHLKRVVATGLAIMALARVATGQTNLVWQTLDGGGGTSTGGVYAVSGTIGQPDTGISSGGSLRLSGGFWALIELVQTPGAPTLRIVRHTATSFLLTWSVKGSEGYHLQEANSLSEGDWNDVSGTPTVVGEECQVVVSPLVEKHFYRLVKP